MNNKQRDTILSLLKTDKMNRSYINRYWFSYMDFLDPTDASADFSCEHLEGKQPYIALIEKFLCADQTAKIFGEIYGLEEDNNEQYICAETLIIFSKLPLNEIASIFNEPEDIFPSDIAEETDFSRPTFLIDANGEAQPINPPPNDDYSIF